MATNPSFNLKDWLEKNTLLFLLISLTLGLAPFTPEPHIVGKLRWVMGGAKGMTMIDFGDLLLHGIPWVLLIVSTLLKVLKFTQEKN